MTEAAPVPEVQEAPATEVPPADATPNADSGTPAPSGGADGQGLGSTDLTVDEQQASAPSISDPDEIGTGYAGPTLDEIATAREARDEFIHKGSKDPVYTATEATTYEKIAEAVGLGYPGVLQLATLNEQQVGALIEEGDEVRLPKEYTYDGIDNVTTSD